MIFGLVLCVLIIASSACPPDAQTTPQTAAPNEGATTRSLKKRSIGCNPTEVIIEAVTKMHFGTSDENEKIDRAIRAKILELLNEKEIHTEKYGEFVHSKTSNNGFFTIQYAFADSMQYCDDFMHFGEIGVKEIPEILELLNEKEIQTEKYGEFVHSKTSNNGFFTIQYAFADSMQYCDDFMHFGEIGVKEIPEIGKVIVTCGCEQPKTF
uniref:SCP domain-containing protein n=1 Tax=Ascaris lumbricoides TaxID=6252 RepID=A0A0M3IBP9_ASCLU